MQRDPKGKIAQPGRLNSIWRSLIGNQIGARGSASLVNGKEQGPTASGMTVDETAGAPEQDPLRSGLSVDQLSPEIASKSPMFQDKRNWFERNILMQRNSAQDMNNQLALEGATQQMGFERARALELLHQDGTITAEQFRHANELNRLQTGYQNSRMLNDQTFGQTKELNAQQFTNNQALNTQKEGIDRRGAVLAAQLAVQNKMGLVPQENMDPAFTGPFNQFKQRALLGETSNEAAFNESEEGQAAMTANRRDVLAAPGFANKLSESNANKNNAVIVGAGDAVYDAALRQSPGGNPRVQQEFKDVLNPDTGKLERIMTGMSSSGAFRPARQPVPLAGGLPNTSPTPETIGPVSTELQAGPTPEALGPDPLSAWIGPARTYLDPRTGKSPVDQALIPLLANALKVQPQQIGSSIFSRKPESVVGSNLDSYLQQLQALPADVQNSILMKALQARQYK